MTPARKNIHSGLFIFGLILALVGLPLSKFLLSISFFVLSGNWLLEGSFGDKWARFRSSPVLWIILGFYLLHFPAMAWSEDLRGWYDDARVKFPLFLLPLIIGTSPALATAQWKWLIRLFTGAVLLKLFISLGVYLHWWGKPYADVREITGSLSHIRFSLMLCLNVILLYFFEFRGATLQRKLMVVALWIIMLFMILLLRNLTGMMILGACCLFLFILYLFRSGKNIITLGIGAVLLITVVFFSYRTWTVYKTYFVPIKVTIEPLAQSSKGAYYSFDTTMNALENGYRLGDYIAWTEMEQTWDARSTMSVNGKDKRGNELRFTLIRFLTSKGWRKDGDAIEKLSDEEVAAIENGVANVVYLTEGPLTARIHQVLWELNEYTSAGSDPSGHSVTQRFEFWKAAMHCWEENFWFGAGTGDAAHCMQEAYVEIDTPLKKENRLKPHDQYLSVAIGMGMFGLLVFLSSLLLPFAYHQHRKILYFIFIVIMGLSMFTEDTLETQVGATLFALWNSLLLFHFPQKKEE